MNLINTQIDYPKRKPANQQVADILRQKILSGDIFPGSRIPSTHTLAKTWGLHVASVHSALTLLVKEGLLDRYHGKGTFVRQSSQRITQIGVYVNRNIWGDDAHWGFARCTQRLFQELLQKKRVREKVWFDSRPLDEQVDGWDDLLKAARQRDMQGIAVLNHDFRHDWLSTLALPVAGYGAGSVAFDVDQFMKISVKHLAAKGCKSIGIISTLRQTDRPIQTLLKTVARAGMQIRPEWIRVLESSEYKAQSFGYGEFQKLWKQKSRPEGLIIYPDILVPGAVMSMFKEGVRTPEDLELILHKNREVDYLCPLQATFVESSCQKYVESLWTQLERQVNGETVSPILIPHVLSTTPNPLFRN